MSTRSKFKMPDATPDALAAAPAGAPARDARARLRARAALPPRVRRRRRHPGDLASLADLARFPFTTKEDLRQNYPFGMFAVPREQVGRVHASSGTTGKPTVVGYTREDLDIWAEVMARSIRAAGGRPGRHRARRLRLRAVHRRARRALRRGAAGLHRRPGLRWHDPAAGAADRGLRAAGDHGDPVVLPGDPRRDGGAGRRPRGTSWRSASSAPSRGPTRCGARSSGGAASRPSTSTGSRR